MSYVEFFTLKIHGYRIVKHLDVKFSLEIVEHPHIVVAGKENQWDSIVPELHEFSH